MSSSPVKPHVRRERARFEEIERVSRGDLRERQSSEKHRIGDRTSANTLCRPTTGTHSRSKSASASSSSSEVSDSASPPKGHASPTRSDRPSTSGTQQTTPITATYPNYYDYSENAEDLKPAAVLLQTPKRAQNQNQNQNQSQTQNQNQTQNTANMAMQGPIQPQQQQQVQQQQQQQQPLNQRLVDQPPAQHTGQTHSLSPASRPSSQSAQATPRQVSAPLTTAQLHQAVAARRGSLTSNATSHTRVPSNGTGTASRDKPPSYAGSNNHNNVPRSPADDIFPPNKVDLDAARYRHAQAANLRASRDRSAATTDRDHRPPPPAKEQRDVKRASQINGRPASMNMGLPHHSGGRPASPESLPTSTGHNIRRLSTPSIPNVVLQPLDAKVVEYGTLMADAQGEMARLDEEMRLLQDRQREAEQRFLEAKAKHDDYRRQYSDVERALRGDFATHGRGLEKRHQHQHHDHGDTGPVPPMPSMPNLQQYGVESRQNSGMALNGGGTVNASTNTNGNGNQGHPGMRSQRTVSIQSDLGDADMSRPGSKRGRFSRLFGV